MGRQCNAVSVSIASSPCPFVGDETAMVLMQQMPFVGRHRVRDNLTWSAGCCGLRIGFCIFDIGHFTFHLTLPSPPT
jgi:hypothetical protein